MLSARIRIAARLLAVAALAALTAGCFQPMYAEHTDGTPGLREKLMGVDLPPIDKAERLARGPRRGRGPQRAGVQALRHGHRHAADPPPGDPLQHQQTSLIVDPNTGLPSSENYGIDAQYNLIEVATGKSVMTGTTFSRVSYDMPGSYQRFSRNRARARCRGSRRQRDRREHQHPARRVLHRRHLGLSFRAPTAIPESRSIWAHGRAARKRDRRLPRPARCGPSDHPALWSRCRPRARTRRCADRIGRRRSQRSLLAGQARRRRALRRAVAPGRRSHDRAAVRRPPRHPRPRRLAQLCQRHRHAGRDVA